jgi:integrase
MRPIADKISLTKAVIEALEPKQKSYLTHDSSLRGLCIKVRPTGRKTFMVYRSVSGRPTKVTIGSWPEWNVVAARQRATTIMADLAQGKHRPKRNNPTLETLIGLYTEHLVASGKKHSGYVKATCRLSWKGLYSTRLDDITVVQLQEAHNDIAVKRGKAAAARAVKVLRSVYTYASQLELTERNPAKKVRLIPCKSREVFLGPAHLSLFWRALATMPEVVQHYFALLLFTGARRSNVAGMRWTNVDLDTALWTIPAEEAKGGQTIHAPLIPEAVAILRGRVNSSPFVFPSPKAASGHLMEPWFWLKELREKMNELGCNVEWTIHDLRRTHASMLTAAGVPLSVVAKALGHANVQTTPIYARVGLETVRAALESARGLIAGK